MLRLLLPAFVVAAGLIAAPSTLPAADNPLAAIPKDASVVLRLKKPQGVVAKLAGFANNIDQQYGAQIQGASPAIGMLISNPTQQGIDHNRDWWVAVFPQAEAPPRILFAIPTNDANAMKNALAGNFHSREYEDWLLYTESEELQTAVAAVGDGGGLKLERAATQLMDGADISVFINIKQLTSIYKEQLEEGRQEIEEGLQELENLEGQVQGVNMTAVAKLYRDVVKAGLDVLHNSEFCTIGLSIGERDIAIEEIFRVTPDSDVDKFLKTQTTGELALLSSLPAEHVVLGGFRGNWDPVIKWSSSLIESLLELDEEHEKQVKDLLAEWSRLKLGDYLFSFGWGDLETGAVRTAAVFEVTPADKFRELMHSYSEIASKLYSGGVEVKVEIKKDAEKYGDRSGDIVKVETTVNPENDPLGIQTQLMSKLYGPEGQVQRMVTLKDRVAQTMGGGREAMQALLKSLDAGPANAASPVQKTRAQLQPKANVVVLLDLPRFLSEILVLVGDSGQVPVPIDTDAIRNLELGKSYGGFSAAVEEHGVRVKTHVPVEQIKGTVKLIMTLQAAAGQPQF